MTSRLRIRLATALVALILVWPPVQHGLSRTFELDPWSFFGFAMYSVPNFETTVRAGALRGEGAEPDWNGIPVASYRHLRDYALRRTRWGALLPPDRLAAELLERHDDLDGVVIRIRRYEIDSETERIVARERDHSYRRSSEGS